MKKKKIWIILMIIFIISLIIYAFSTFFINKKTNTSKNEKRIGVVYLLVDKDKTPSNVSYDNFADVEENILYSLNLSEKLTLTKNKKYYVASFNNVNKLARKNIIDYSVALDDVFANIVDDVKYDKKNNRVYIPRKYYDDKNGNKQTLRIEFMSRIKKDDLKKININYSNNKIFSKNKNYIMNYDSPITTFPVYKYKKNGRLSKNDFEIYLNGQKEKLNEEKYDINSTAGTVSIKLNPLYINSIYIKTTKLSKLKRTFLSFLSVDDVSAKMKYAGTWVDTADSDTSVPLTNFVEKSMNIKNANYMYGNAIRWYNNGYVEYVDKSDPSKNYSGYWYNADMYCGGTWTIGNNTFACTPGTSYTPSSNKTLKKIVNAAMKSKATSANSNGYDDLFLIDLSTMDGKTQTATNSDGTKTRKISITIDANYIKLWCSHESAKAAGSSLNLYAKISSISGNKITIQVWNSESVGTQSAVGYFYLTKGSTPSSLKVKKYNYDVAPNTISGLNATASSKSDILFKLYESSKDGDCEGYIDEASTNGSGEAIFKNLDAGDYCVKETYSEYDDDSSISSYEYIRANKITNVATLQPVPGNSGGNAVEISSGKAVSCTASTSTPTCNYYNLMLRYCYRITKKDLVNSNSVVSWKDGTITVQDSNGNVAKNAGNVITLQGYHYDDVKDGITVSEITNTTPVNSNGEEYYSNGFRDTNGSPYSITLKSPSAASTNAQVMQLQKVGDNYQWVCPSFTATDYGSDVKKYQCVKALKTDLDNDSPLAGANFTTNCSNGAGDSKFSNSSGIATLYAGTKRENATTTCTISEIKPPVGYAKSLVWQQNVTEGAGAGQIYTMTDAQAIAYRGQGDAAVIADIDKWCNASPNNTTCGQNGKFCNPSLKLTWYKTVEDNVQSLLKTNDSKKTAKFNVSLGSTKIYHSSKVSATNSTGTERRSCYQYSATSTGSGSDVFESDENGQVCIKGIPEGKYRVTEIDSAEYHTFSQTYYKDIDAVADFAPKTIENSFINLPTYFEFKKDVNDGDNEDIKIVVNGVEKSLHDLTTEELSRIDFNVYSGNDLLSFVETTDENGKMVYSFGGNTIDLPTGNVVTDLHLDSERWIRISHLPKGTYTIKEKNNKVCDNNSNNNDCIGYYYPDYKQSSDYTFTITACSNDAANATACSSAGLSKGKATQKLTNKRTEIMFTKKDFYKYYDQKDIVDFENDKERSDFDRIKFKIKDASGRYLTVKKVKDVGTQTGDNSYSEYRYVSTDDNSDDGGTVMYARGGNIKITNLCRGNTYTIEEIEVPEDSVFVKENTSSTPTSVSYNIPCNELATGTDTKGSTTNIIEDKPTRIRLEKRDSKYNYLIPDETTTFKLYRCKKGEECHPGDYSSDEEREKAGMKLIKFYDRARISNDEEDPTDAEGLAGVEVYKMMSDSDIASGTKTVVDLHPYKGILVLRYLQANYNYVLLETVAPKNYQLPVGRNAETTFKPVNDTVDVDSVDVPNKPTSLLIKKYDSKGNLLPGAEFKIYDAGTSCDPNISAADQKKTELKLKTIRDGIYENRENKDTDTVKTCRDREDEKCSDINPNAITKLTYETNLGNWSDFADESTKTEDGKKIEIQEGTALIQYLEYGHCYVIEETKAPDGHSLPTKDKDRFTMVTIKENDEYAHSTYYKFINKPTPFQFYKYDEFNKLLDGAEFKLQKLDDNKKYHDVTVSLDDDLKNLETIDEKDAEKLNKKITELKTQAESGVPFYKVDTTTDNTTITTKNGTAVVYYLSPGQYRILETKAAPGKELSKNPNIATFFVDSNGNVFGNSIIVNKSKTEKIQVKNSASAELVVNVQTGQTVIKYGLIISVIAALITGLMILRKRMK